MNHSPGPFCVIVRRSGGWFKLTALYQSRNWRGIGRTHSHHRERSDALTSLKVTLK